MILATVTNSIYLPLEKNADFLCSKSQQSSFPGSTQKHKKAKQKVCKGWCHSQFKSQAWYPDSDQVLVLRKKAELN